MELGMYSMRVLGNGGRVERVCCVVSEADQAVKTNRQHVEYFPNCTYTQAHTYVDTAAPGILW